VNGSGNKKNKTGEQNLSILVRKGRREKPGGWGGKESMAFPSEQRRPIQRRKEVEYIKKWKLERNLISNRYGKERLKRRRHPMGKTGNIGE